jgi:ribosomal protein S3
MGRVGVKVWVYNGEILPPRAEETEELENIEVTVQAGEPDEALEMLDLDI